MGGDDDGGDKEKDEEEERLRQEAIKEAEAGDFVSAKELTATVRKFVPNG